MPALLEHIDTFSQTPCVVLAPVEDVRMADLGMVALQAFQKWINASENKPFKSLGAHIIYFSIHNFYIVLDYSHRNQLLLT